MSSEIKTKIQEDIKVAMKAREQDRLTQLRSLSSAIKQVEIDTRKDLDDAGVVAILQKEIKKRRDAMEFAKTAGREELVAQNQAEIVLIQSYLGEQLGEEELRKLIAGLIAGGASNIGAVMGELNKSYKGKFEGKLASELIKQMLG